MANAGQRSVVKRDHLAGALTALTGAVAAYAGYGYDIGSVTEMGPGFFPFALGIVLVALGLLIAANPGADADAPAENPLDLRGAGCILGSIGLFLVAVQYGGLLPAAFLATFVAAWGDREATPLGTVLIATLAAAIGFLLFHRVLQLPLPLFRWG